MTATVIPSGFFAIRTPLLSFTEMLEWSYALKAPLATSDAELAIALKHDRELLRERLSICIRRPEVREALFLASPTFEEGLSHWEARPESSGGQKTERTLMRYLARMAGRPTPFGLFAGCSVGVFANATKLVINGIEKHTRHTRLDGDFLLALAESVHRDAAMRRVLTYYPNSSIYYSGGRLCYAESSLVRSQRSYRLVAVESTSYLESTLLRASEGAQFSVLANALVDAEVTIDEAIDYVEQLIDSQILVPDLVPAVTGPEPIHDLISQLSRHSETRNLAKTLRPVHEQLAEMDALPIGVPPATYRRIASALESLPTKVELSRLFQVDMTTSAANVTLGPSVLKSMLQGIELIQKIVQPPHETELARFRKAFVERYGEREIVLPEVLDDDLGIGFSEASVLSGDASPLLDGLVFGENHIPFGTHDSWNGFNRILLRKFEESLRAGSREVVIDDADIEGLKAKHPQDLAHSIALIATIVASSSESINMGDYSIWLRGIDGPSGANLLGRFCHGDDVLADLVGRHLRAEESQMPEAVFAEVVHLPDGRIGNVLLRPQLRKHEIPYLGRSGAPIQDQIGIGDLFVSVRDGRVVLRSLRLDCEVLPRLTTAHNFLSTRNLPIYRFLCALQTQDVGRFTFSWGPLEASSYLPRVRFNKIILSLERWRFEGVLLEKLSRSTGDQCYLVAREIRRSLKLPRWVGVVDGDNVLPIDLENVLSVETFAHLVRQRSSVYLTEIFDDRSLCVQGPGGMFSHELVVPLIVKREPIAANRMHRRYDDAANKVRFRSLGTDWLYVKLYTGPRAADDVIRKALAPLLQQVRGAVNGWFFIRYGDPDWHLRVRFHGDSVRLREDVLPKLETIVQASIESNQILKLQIDTYDREIERYGGIESILLAEELFFADSEACLDILGLLAEDSEGHARWGVALCGMDLLLNDLGFELKEKNEIVRRCRRSFVDEFRIKDTGEKWLAEQFRHRRSTLEALLDSDSNLSPNLDSIFNVLRVRSERIRPISMDLRALEQNKRMHCTVAEMAPSFLHMYANRMLPTAARAQEMVLYYFLDRLYEGRIARARRRGLDAVP